MRRSLSSAKGEIVRRMQLMPRLRRFDFSYSALGVGLVTALALVPSALSVTSTKYYTASISPTSASVGGPTTFTLTITNSKNSTQALGSANITVPPRFELPAGVGIPVAPAGKKFTATLNAAVIELRNPGPSTKNALSPGESVSIPLTATASCGQTGPTAPFATVAKQSNDFKGSGNDFVNTGADPWVALQPAALKEFKLDAVGDQKAGVPFVVTAAAYDLCGNVKTDYAGGATLAGDLNSSPSGKAPDYGALQSWTGGSASATVTAYKAEGNRHLTVTGGAAAGTSNPFAVSVGDPASLTFAVQPSDTSKGEIISPSPAVAVADTWGNPVPGTAVGIAVGLNPTGAALEGTASSTASGAGVATFGDLAIALASPDPYTLVASSGTLSTGSAEFYVADAICTGSSCSGAASSAGGTSIAVDAAGTTSGDRLYIAFEGSDGAANCGWDASYVQGDGSEILLATSSQPSLTITWQLPAAIRKLYPNNGVAHYDICLAARRLDGGTGGFTTKDGTTAGLGADGYYWGLLPDCNGVGPQNPCIISRSSNDAGDIVIRISVPYPWDPRIWGG
jgi:hypothetical protein